MAGDLGQSDDSLRELLADRELERISYSEPFYSLLYRFADDIPRRSITAREIVKAALEARDRCDRCGGFTDLHLHDCPEIQS